MRNLARIVGIVTAAALVGGAACEKKEQRPAAPAQEEKKPEAPAQAPEVCGGPEARAKEEAAQKEKTAAEQAPNKQKVAEAVDALDVAFAVPLRAGKPLDRAKLESLVSAVNAARHELGGEAGGSDPLAKATELADHAQLCRAVQADDAKLCDKAGTAAKACRGRLVQLRRLGAAMIGRKRCDQAVADAAAKIEQARDAKGQPLVTLCEAAVSGDATKCSTLTEAPHVAICSALVTGEAAACAKLDEKQQASCAADAALIAGASGGVAKAPSATLPPDAQVLIDAAQGKAGKTACVDEAAREWHEYLATLK